MKRIGSVLLAASTMVLLALPSVYAMASRQPADPNTPPPPAWVQFVPIMAMVGIFYLLLIRPQAKQRRQREAMVNSIQKGTKIVTNGGFFATVTNVGPNFLEVKLNEETKVKIQRSAVAEVLPAENAVREPELVSNGK